MKRCVAVILWLAVASGVASAWAQAGDESPEAKAKSIAWSPKQEDRDRFKLITRVNIFLTERPRIVEDRPREQRAEPDAQAAPPPPPPDPDRQKVLVGVSVLDELDAAGAPLPQRVVVFIEDRATGEVTRLTEPGPFSKGEVIELGLDGLTYVVGDERRQIRVGQSLTGETPAPPAGATPVPNGAAPSSSPTATPPGNPGSATPANPEESDVLRRLRERRNRE